MLINKWFIKSQNLAATHLAIILKTNINNNKIYIHEYCSNSSYKSAKSCMDNLGVDIQNRGVTFQGALHGCGTLLDVR